MIRSPLLGFCFGCTLHFTKRDGHFYMCAIYDTLSQVYNNYLLYETF
jgi:hypothetical protein